MICLRGPALLALSIAASAGCVATHTENVDPAATAELFVNARDVGGLNQAIQSMREEVAMFRDSLTRQRKLLPSGKAFDLERARAVMAKWEKFCARKVDAGIASARDTCRPRSVPPDSSTTLIPCSVLDLLQEARAALTHEFAVRVDLERDVTPLAELMSRSDKRIEAVTSVLLAESGWSRAGQLRDQILQRPDEMSLRLEYAKNMGDEGDALYAADRPAAGQKYTEALAVYGVIILATSEQRNRDFWEATYEYLETLIKLGMPSDLNRARNYWDRLNQETEGKFDRGEFTYRFLWLGEVLREK